MGPGFGCSAAQWTALQEVEESELLGCSQDTIGGEEVEMELLGKLLAVKYLDGDLVKGNCLIHGVKELPDMDDKEFLQLLIAVS